MVEHHAEITGPAVMQRVIEEEWEALEFEETIRPCGRRWIGINALCRIFPCVCDEVIEQEGWDTRHVK